MSNAENALKLQEADGLCKEEVSNAWSAPGSYVSVDLETTGVSLSRDKIIEVGLLKVVDDHITDKFQCVINPCIPIGEAVLALTNISICEIRNALTVENVIERIVDFCRGFVLLGHNTVFDYGFIKKEALRVGLDYEKRGIDTYKLCKRILPDGVRKNLSDACEYFNIERKNAHRAFSDAYYTHLLYQAIKSNDRDLQIAAKPLNVKLRKFRPVRKRTKEDLRNLLNCHRIECKANIDLLSESEAKRYIDKIRAGVTVFDIE